MAKSIGFVIGPPSKHFFLVALPQTTSGFVENTPPMIRDKGSAAMANVQLMEIEKAY